MQKISRQHFILDFSKASIHRGKMKEILLIYRCPQRIYFNYNDGSIERLKLCSLGGDTNFNIVD